MFIERQSNRVTIFLVQHGEQKIRVVYDKQRKTIATCLPMHSDPEHSQADQRTSAGRHTAAPDWTCPPRGPSHSFMDSDQFNISANKYRKSTIMNPTLQRQVRLARQRLYGTPLDQEAQKEEQRTEAIKQLKWYLAEKISLEVYSELFSNPRWDQEPAGPFVQFGVDGQSFVLVQSVEVCKLYHSDERNTPLAELSDNDDFQDNLLVAIDEALRSSE